MVVEWMNVGGIELESERLEFGNHIFISYKIILLGCILRELYLPPPSLPLVIWGEPVLGEVVTTLHTII